MPAHSKKSGTGKTYDGVMTKAKNPKTPGLDKPPKGKALRKMTDKEKKVLMTISKNMNSSQIDTLRMKVMRSKEPVDTPAKMKKLL